MEFTTNLNVPYLKLRYFAFNCLEIKFPSGKTLVVDPCLIKEGRFSCGYDESVLEGCDYVYVNHTHADHVASLDKVYDRFKPLVMANSAVAYDLATFYDIPYIQIIPYVSGDTFDFGDFKLDILHARHALNNMRRPSGKEDDFENVFFKAGMKPIEYSSPLEEKLGNLGTLFNNNFVMTLPCNLKIGFFAGNPGLTAPEDREMWKTLKPDIIFAHRAKYTVDYANMMADVLELTGARLMMPLHMEDAYSGAYDPAEYTANVNKVCQERGLTGRMMFLERAKWYEFYSGVAAV